MQAEFRSRALPAPLPAPLPTSEAAFEVAAETRSFYVEAQISCIVPCLNEADNLCVLLPALRNRLESLCSAWEIIVIDDGSTDNTAELMANWSGLDGFRYIQLARNFGKEAAISAGLEAADGDVVICLDADMQHPPALIEEMLRRWQAGSEMVYAVRRNRDDEGYFKRLGSDWFYRLLSGSRVDVPAGAGDFRLMDRRVVNALVALPERTRFMKGLYAWVGFKCEPLPYTPDSRMHGQSHFRPMKLIGLAMDGLTAFTTWPLRVVSMLGLVFALMSMVYGAYLVGAYFLDGNPVSGWTTIVTALLFFAGINLLSLGVVGEYVARIFDEVKGRPLYITRQRRGRARAARKANKK
ncbi:glycosyltransferase family 2 protein [Bordetella avium]|uniref:Bactoprenol glucosyl transferase n=1 Tax=Bordetella avium (strain 197N) TaxID=360910 RepID=Q2KV67_BORA1|nr:glycosyltransferase family 2 protein [Bordetella avium]AZY53677.1 glycosyltransferase [Bordetella avium]RIQ15549.1 glycosyltransferase [Bordetella avium]RIQ20113.1 glycosyltransferase [Bordetella avium]RIQ34703.1 glycosyltransferase [Bordetella avium]RIQ55866.1 glycosyltransferase [Bordetella avium]